MRARRVHITFTGTKGGTNLVSGVTARAASLSFQCFRSHSRLFNTAQGCEVDYSASDLAGLHALYPVCDGQIAAAVSCVKTARHSGWLRLASVVLPPFLLSVVLVLLPLHFLRRREARRMRQLLESHARLNESHARLSERYSSLRASVARAVARPFSASAPSTASPTRQPSRASVAASSAHGAKPRGGGRRVHPAPVGGSDGGPGGPPQLLVVEEEPGGVTEATAGGRRGEGRRRRDRPHSIEVSDAATTAAATAPSF